MFKGFIFDLDGIVYRNDKLISGADKVIKLLRESGRKWNEAVL
jgi:ribonucleotide monophosphatase NagD (HAD superfamily)